MERVSRYRAHGIIVDVTAIDVMDSFAARSIRTIAHMTRLRGADTVIVGLQPEVAFAMVQLGLMFDDMYTALDLEEGLALLNRQLETKKPANGRDGGD
jgi:rsbT antagonist protein RsbS